MLVVAGEGCWCPLSTCMPRGWGGVVLMGDEGLFPLVLG